MSQLFYFKPKAGIIEWTTPSALLKFLAIHEGKLMYADMDRAKGIRTPDQNAALHLYFTMLADELNAAGYTVQLVLKEKIDLDWDKDKVKELLWRPAQQAITGKKSTTSLNKVSDIDEIFEHLNRHIGEKFGIHIPFPSEVGAKRFTIKS